MDQVIEIKTTPDNLEEWSKKRGDDTTTTRSRLETFERISKLSLPNLKYSIGVGSRLNKLLLEDLPNKNADCIVHAKGVKVLQGKDALTHKGLFSIFDRHENKLTALHAAFLTNVVVIEIPKDTVVNEPIIISSELKGAWNADHILVIANENACASIIDYSSSKEESWRTHGVEIIAKPYSKVTYASIQDLDKRTTQLAFHKADVRKDAIVTWVEGSFGSNQTIARTWTDLSGEGAHVNVHGVFFGYRDQKFDMEGVIHHLAKNTTSDLFVRGALTGHAKAIFRGLIKIHANAPGCRGYQKEDVLLLSHTAEADAIPILEIDNDDVKCSHAATVGKVDQDLLFYLQSRGITKVCAEKMLIKAFFNDLFEKIQDETIRGRLEGLVVARSGEDEKDK